MGAQHRFKDEWLSSLIKDLPQITPEVMSTWRTEERP